jgi:acyl carrier protein
MLMNLQDRVKQIVGKALNLSADSIRLEASLKDDLGATSLDRYTILMDIENEFSLDLDDVPEEELGEKIRTVADVVAFLQKRVPS